MYSLKDNIFLVSNVLGKIFVHIMLSMFKLYIHCIAKLESLKWLLLHITIRIVIILVLSLNQVFDINYVPMCTDFMYRRL